MFSFSKKILSKLLSLLNNSLSTLKISGRNIYNHSAFTLTELIVVITILSILSVIGFVVMSHQSSVARDGKRISDIQTLSQSAKITSAQLRLLPTPIADSVSLTVSGTFIGYQGFMSTSIVNPLGYGSDKIFDPKDNIPYTYRVNQHYDSAQFMAYLENPRFERSIEIAKNQFLRNEEIGMNGFGGLFDGKKIQEIASQSLPSVLSSTLSSALPSTLPSLFSQAYALDSSTTDLSSRYPYSAGDRLGIFLSKGSNQPLQNGVTGTGSRDISLSDTSTLTIMVGSSGADGYVSTDISTGSLLSLKDGSFDEKSLLGMNGGSGGSGSGGGDSGGGGGGPVSHILTMGEYSMQGNTYYGYLGPLTISVYASFGVNIITITPGSLIDDTVDGYVIDTILLGGDSQNYQPLFTVLAGSTDMPSNVSYQTPYANISCTPQSSFLDITPYNCTGSTVSTDFYVGSQHDLGVTFPPTLPTLPNPSDISNAPLSTDIISNIVTASHISTPIPLTVSDAEFRVNGGSWVTSANISDGDQVEYKTFVTQENEEKRITINFNNIQSEWTVLARGSCFSIDNNGVIFSYNAACGGVVTIPESIDSRAVTGIGNSAFAGKGLTSVTFPTNISIEVQNSAFEWNGLTSIVIPDNIWFRGYQVSGSVNGVPSHQWGPYDGWFGWGNGAFRNNLIPNSTSITIRCPMAVNGLFGLNGSNRQTYIDPCTPLLQTPNNITNAPLNTDIISDVVTASNISTPVPLSVSGAEFRVNGGSWVTSANISNGDQVEYKVQVTQEGEHKVVSINFNGTISEWIVDSPSICFILSANTITGYNNICGTNVVIPSLYNAQNVTAIGYGAFYNKGLTSVSIPDSITIIGGNAFANNQLSSIFIPNSVITIGDVDETENGGAFYNNQLNSLVIGNSVVYIGNKAFWRNNLTSITIPESVVHLGYVAFGENQLSSINIPNSVISMNDSVFYDNQISSLSFGSGITSIGNNAFYSNQLTSVTIPSSVTSIGYNAFYENKLTSITLPSSLTSIGASAFSVQTNSFGNGTVYGPSSGYVKNTYINNTNIAFDKVKLPNYIDIP